MLQFRFLLSLSFLACLLACEDRPKSKDAPDNRNFDISDTTKKAGRQGAEAKIADTLIKRTDAYQDIDIFNQDRAKVRFKDLYGYIDRDSFEIIKPQYTSATRFEDSLARVGKAGKYGVIDWAGKEIVPFEYEELGQIRDSMLAFKKDKLYGFLYLKEPKKPVVEPRYEWAGNFVEKRAKVMRKGKWTFVNTAGKEITPLQYDAVRDFKEGLAAVWINYKWGYLNPKGEIVIPPTFDQALDFTKGKAQVMLKDKTFYINSLGKTL